MELLVAASAILLIAGLLTPCAAAVLGVLEIVRRASLSPAACSLSACNASTTLVAAIAVAIAVLGPGALSVDARLFGFREIIIPATRAGESRDRRTER